MTAIAEPHNPYPDNTPAGEEEPEHEEVYDHVVVCLGGLSAHTNGSPIFSCLVYGPFTAEEVGEKAREIMRIEGSATFVRPLVDLANTYRRLSAD